MLDIAFIRENAEFVAQKSKQKGYEVNITELLALDAEKKTQLQAVEQLRQKRNEIASSSKGAKPTDELIEAGKAIKEQITVAEDALSKLEVKLTAQLKSVPNMPADDVPVGNSEDENVVSKVSGFERYAPEWQS